MFTPKLKPIFISSATLSFKIARENYDILKVKKNGKLSRRVTWWTEWNYTIISISERERERESEKEIRENPIYLPQTFYDRRCAGDDKKRAI